MEYMEYIVLNQPDYSLEPANDGFGFGCGCLTCRVGSGQFRPDCSPMPSANVSDDTTNTPE